MSAPRPLLALSALILLGTGAVAAQAAPRSRGDTVRANGQDSSVARPDSAALVLRGDTLMYLYGSVGPFSPEERASAALARIRELRRAGSGPDSVRIVDDGTHAEVWVGTETVLSVTPADTAARGMSRSAAATVMAEGVRAGLAAPFLTRNLQQLLFGLLWTLLATAVLYGVLRAMGRWYPRLYRRIRDIQEDKLPALRFQGLVLLTGERIEAVILFAARASRLLFAVLLLLVYFPLVFSFFPPTRLLAQRILDLALTPIRSVSWAAVNYLPNLFYIGVILILAYYGLRVVGMVFDAVGNGTIRVRGFYPDWAEPTFKLIRVLLVAFTLILIWPYLPNSSSAAFKGVAAFFGLLLTFGSAGAVANVVGGVVMIYMRPFQIGDRVKIADTIGDVVYRGMLVTRLRTPKNVEITIPNSMVLGSFIVNYSATAHEGGIVLHTSVTIGYATPWPRVHEALKEAALRTPDVLEEPEPFVLQTALGDSAASYEINVYTDQPQHMLSTYSSLHQNVQDVFAERGIEILSPLYHAVRDGNLSTIPEPHTPSSSDGAFRVTNVDP